MDTELMLDVGQANEFKLALRRNGWTLADVKRLCEGDLLARVLPVVQGRAEATPIKHLVDLDSAPFVLEGWEVEDHQKGGQFEWNVEKIKLFVSVNQQNNNVIKGHELRKELKSKTPFNANLLDFLLAHPHLVPEEWKSKYVYFWGTIYRLRSGRLCVRYLCWRVGRWDWRWHCLDWDEIHPAVVPAS